jgi:uncharacterized protein (DUF1778 family)
MARHRSDYAGERFTEKVTLHFTPSQRELLERSAQKVGATISQHGRELCLRRVAAAEIVAGTRRNPDASALVKELVAVGNNLNQLAKVANTNRATPQLDELKETTDQLKAVFARVLAL